MSDKVKQNSKDSNREDKKFDKQKNNYKKSQNKNYNQNNNQNKKVSDKSPEQEMQVQAEAIPFLGLENHGIHITPGNFVSGLTFIGNCLLILGVFLPFVKFTVSGNSKVSSMLELGGTNVHGIALIIMAILSIILTIAKHRNTSGISNILCTIYVLFFTYDVVRQAAKIVGMKEARVSVGLEFLSGFVLLAVGIVVLLVADVYLFHNEFFDNDIDEGIDDIELKGSKGLHFILDLISYVVISLCIISSIAQI